jgi:hypothetical protein
VKKVSGKTHTKEQLDNWANQNNPNNKAYRANANNHSNQLNPKHKTHQQRHNAERRYQKMGFVITEEKPSPAPACPDNIHYCLQKEI